MMISRVKYKNYKDFSTALKNKKFDLIDKITNSIILAVSKKKKSIQVFEIYVESEGIYYDYIIKDDTYLEFLNNYLEEYIKIEDYMKCAEIKKAIDSYEKDKENTSKI